MAVDTEKLIARIDRAIEREALLPPLMASDETYETLKCARKALAALRRVAEPVPDAVTVPCEGTFDEMVEAAQEQGKLVKAGIRAEPVGEDQLPPCPFCGGEARHAHPSRAPAVYCSNCRSSSPDVRIWRGEMQDIAASERALAGDDRVARLEEALRRIADPRNIHFRGDAQVVARAALEDTRDGN